MCYFCMLARWDVGGGSVTLAHVAAGDRPPRSCSHRTACGTKKCAISLQRARHPLDRVRPRAHRARRRRRALGCADAARRGAPPPSSRGAGGECRCPRFFSSSSHPPRQPRLLRFPAAASTAPARAPTIAASSSVPRAGRRAVLRCDLYVVPRAWCRWRPRRAAACSCTSGRSPRRSASSRARFSGCGLSRRTTMAGGS